MLLPRPDAMKAANVPVMDIVANRGQRVSFPIVRRGVCYKVVRLAKNWFTLKVIMQIKRNVAMKMRRAPLISILTANRMLRAFVVNPAKQPFNRNTGVVRPVRTVAAPMKI